MTQRLVIGGLVAAAVFAVVALRPQQAVSPPPTVEVATTAAGKPKLLDLGATTCAPCKAMVPVLEGLRASYGDRLDVEFINVWERQEAGETWRVRVMPTQVFLAGDGKELARHEGFMSRADIVAQWRLLGVPLD